MFYKTYIKISDFERKHELEIEVLKQKHHDAMKRLQDEIRFIKTQKVIPEQSHFHFHEISKMFN